MTADFRLDDLFNVEAEFTLPDENIVLVRVLTETEVSERDEQATRAYKEVEDQMRDDDNDMRKAVIVPLKDASKEALVGIVTAIDAIRYSVQVVRDYPFRFFPYPDDATSEEKAEVLRQQDRHEAAVRDSRRKAIEDRRLSYEERLNERTEEDLRKMAERALVAARADTAKQEEFQVQTVYLSCRRGDSKGPPYFTLDHVRAHGHKGGLSERIYKELLSVYFQLDSVDPWSLQKKL